MKVVKVGGRMGVEPSDKEGVTGVVGRRLRKWVLGSLG